MMLTPRQIARELISPTRTWYVSHVGDSRAVLKNQLIATYSGLAWSGMGPRFATAYSGTGHIGSTQSVTLAGADVNAAIPAETINPWAMRQVHTAAFTGEAEPAGYEASLCYCSITLASYPLLRARLASGGGARVRGIYRRHATGIIGGDGVYLAATSYTAPEVVYTSPVIADTTGTGLVVAEAVIPADFAWATRSDIWMRWLGVPEDANPDGSLFQTADVPWVESDGPGLVYSCHATSGAQWTSWLTDDFAPAQRWADYRDLLGENQILWLSLGVNAVGESAATQAEDIAAVIARFRAANPDGPVVLDTTYPCRYTIGTPATWREASLQVAAATEGCLLVDAYSRRGFEAWYSAGHIADGIHASDAGVAVWMADIGALVAAAAGGDSTMIHADDLRNDYCAAALARIDGGAAAGKIKILDGATVVATITLEDPGGTISGGVLTFAEFPKTDVACDNGGTPDSAVVTDSDDVVILTLTAGVAAGSDVLLAKATYAAGEPLKIDSASYTAPV